MKKGILFEFSGEKPSGVLATKRCSFAAMVFLTLLISAILGGGSAFASTSHSHLVCGNNSCSSHGLSENQVRHSTPESYTALSSVLTEDASGHYSGTITTDGNYYVDQDITLSSTLAIKANVNLCLNGHVLQLEEGASGSVIQVLDKDDRSAYVINIADCDTTTSHTFSENDTLLWTLDNAGTKTHSGGVITGGNNSQGKGGGINLGKYNTLNMYGGSIVGNVAKSGAGIYLTASGTNTSILNMYGGTISHNYASSAAGVQVENGADLHMYSGSINYNYASNYGGGIGTNWSIQKIYIYGGEVIGNEANNGSAIHLYNTELYLDGGLIKDNVSRQSGYATAYAVMSNPDRKIEITGNTTLKDKFYVLTWYENQNIGQSCATGTYISVKAIPSEAISIAQDELGITNGVPFAKWEGSGSAPATDKLFTSDTHKVVAKVVDGETAYYLEPYAIDITHAEDVVSNYVVDPANKKAFAGDIVSVSPTAAEGLTPIISVTCASSDVAAPVIMENNGVYSFTMPSSDVSISIDAGYKVETDIVEHGSISVNKEIAQIGAEVVAVVTPESGYTVKEIQVKCADSSIEAPVVSINGNVGSFVMPESDVIVSATLEQAETSDSNTNTDEGENAGDASDSQDGIEGGTVSDNKDSASSDKMNGKDNASNKDVLPDTSDWTFVVIAALLIVSVASLLVVLRSKSYLQ